MRAILSVRVPPDGLRSKTGNRDEVCVQMVDCLVF